MPDAFRLFEANFHGVTSLDRDTDSKSLRPPRIPCCGR
jgi:hypothetical protein